MCALAPLAVSLALSLPLQAPVPHCPRADTAMAATLLGDARVQPASTDPQFEAQIRAIHAPAPKPRHRRRRR